MLRSDTSGRGQGRGQIGCSRAPRKRPTMTALLGSAAVFWFGVLVGYVAGARTRIDHPGQTCAEAQETIDTLRRVS